MNRIIVLLVFIFAAVSLSGQARYFDERYISTQSYINPVIVNPGAAGSTMYHRLLGNYRSNWSTLPGAPKSYFLSYDGPIGNRIGFGALLLSDKAGDFQTTKGQGTISYTIESENNKIGFGLSGEFIQHTLSGSVSGNVLNNGSDTEIANRLGGTQFFDLSFGIFGVYDKNITYGLALPSLVSSRLDNQTNEFEREISYIANVGYKWDVLGYDFSIEPSIFIKQLNYVPFHLDLNVLMSFLDDKLLGGVSYTVGADERLGFSVGTRVNALNFAYSYNISRRQLQAYNNGGHEFSVKIEIGRTDKMQEIPEEEMMEGQQ